MATTWKKCTSKGIRYREHATRKHGIRPDRYYVIRYKVDGRDREEALGWNSEGWTEEKALARLVEIKEAIRTGTGPQSLREKREQADHARRQAKAQAKVDEARRKREGLTFVQFFEEQYLPAVQGIRKPDSVRKSREHVRNWLGPVLGDVPLLEITSMHLEKVRAAMVQADRSPRSQQYVMATFRAVWNKARNHGLVQAESPTRIVELPRVSNTRQRYLKPFEADALLEAIRRRSFQTWQIALLSLHTGLRFSECCALVWGCIDLEKGVVHVLNGKATKTERST